MKISDLIEQLQKCKDIEGDLEVTYPGDENDSNDTLIAEGVVVRGDTAIICDDTLLDMFSGGDEGDE